MLAVLCVSLFIQAHTHTHTQMATYCNTYLLVKMCKGVLQVLFCARTHSHSHTHIHSHTHTHTHQAQAAQHQASTFALAPPPPPASQLHGSAKKQKQGGSSERAAAAAQEAAAAEGGGGGGGRCQHKQGSVSGVAINRGRSGEQQRGGEGGTADAVPDRHHQQQQQQQQHHHPHHHQQQQQQQQQYARHFHARVPSHLDDGGTCQQTSTIDDVNELPLLGVPASLHIPSGFIPQTLPPGCGHSTLSAASSLQMETTHHHHHHHQQQQQQQQQQQRGQHGLSTPYLSMHGLVSHISDGSRTPPPQYGPLQQQQQQQPCGASAQRLTASGRKRSLPARFEDEGGWQCACVCVCVCVCV